MNLPDFDYYAPESIEATCVLLKKFGPRAKLFSGGTDLLVKMKQGLLTPEVLVSIKQLDQLSDIYYEKNKGVLIGARATHNSIVHSPLLKEKYFSICETARHIANNQIRNRGTVGGNIINAVPSADMPPILIALGAEARLTGSGGKEKVVSLEDFFVGPNKTVIGQDEMMTGVFIPDNNFTGSTYFKFALRRSGALAVVGVAVALAMQGKVCKDARIVLGAVAPTPVRAKKAEGLLKGKTVSEKLFEEVGICAAEESKPISDIRGSAEYRRDMVRVFTRRALNKTSKEGHC
jgi:aerobic carbon-monoxide dehydrogenase medium subunit